MRARKLSSLVALLCLVLALPLAAAEQADWLFGSSGISTTFTGAGLNDATFNGVYGTTGTATFTVEIDGTGTPDTFRWRKNSGSWTSLVAITGGAQTLSDSITVTFGATTGHTATNSWTFTVGSTSSTYQVGGPGFVAIRIFGVGGTATATVVLEEKLRLDEDTWGTIATIGTSFATTAATYTGTACGNIRVRITAYTGSAYGLKGSMTAFDQSGMRTIPFN